MAIHHGKDDIYLSDFWKVMRDVFKNPSFEPSFSVLWDLRKCDVKLNLTGIVALDQTVVDAANEARANGKTAWLVSTDFAESIIRLLYVRYNWMGEWRTFSTFDDAYAWASD